jgi:hypothetical protein
MPNASIRVIRAAAAVVLLAAACGSSDPCHSLAQAYADEVPNALVCDPNEASPCAGTTSFVDYEQDGSQLTLDGLSTCTHSVNAARAGKLASILAAYQKAGCVLLQPPICPPVQDRCVQGADGGGFTCSPTEPR